MASPSPSQDPHKVTPERLRPVSLPDELWTTIFEQLGFHDLRLVEMACKRFQNLLKGHRLASILFRVGPQEPIKKGQKLEIHPMLDLVDCIGTHEGDPDKATLYLDDSVGNAFDYPAVDDFATRPACTKLHIRVSGSAVASVGYNTGITIRQILRKTIPAWLRCFYDSPDGRFDGPFEGRVYWDGWISAEGQEDGSVLLMSRSWLIFEIGRTMRLWERLIDGARR